MIVGVDGRHRGIAQQVDPVGQQEAKRSLGERVDVLRRKLAVAHHDGIAVGDHVRRDDRGGREDHDDPALRFVIVDSEVIQLWDSRGHFFAAAAEAMRRILVENARRKGRVKHGGGRRRTAG